MRKCISLRIDDDFDEMLTKLTEMDKAEAKLMNRAEMNVSEIVKAAVKEYYASKVNDKAMNAYTDLVRNAIDPVVSAATKAVLDAIEENKFIGVTTMQLTRLSMMGMQMATDTPESADEARKYIRSSAGFDLPINESVKEIMNKSAEQALFYYRGAFRPATNKLNELV